MGLHRKNYYQRRKRMIEQTLEAQEKEQRRFNHLVFAVLAAFFLFAIGYSIIKSHNYGMAVIGILLLGWFACYSFQSEIYKLAKEKGWDSVAKMTYDPKTEKPREEALLREERLKNPIDTDTLILVERATELDELEMILFDYVEVECDKLYEDLPLLWKVGEYRYAITFPCGVSRMHLYALADNLITFLAPESIHAWCRPKLFKKNMDGWLYLRNGNDDLLKAFSADGTVWSINEDDAMLFDARPQAPYSTSGYKEYPDIEWGSAEQLGLYY